MTDSVWPHRWQPTRLPRPWDSPGKNTAVGCHFLLQCLEDFEHDLASMWNECNCAVVWTFFGTAPLGFSVLWPLLTFPNFLAHWVQHFKSIAFRMWNSSNGISSPSLALSVVMLPKAHLTSHSRMSGSRWMITPSWLSGCEDLCCTVLLCILATSS